MSCHYVLNPFTGEFDMVSGGGITTNNTIEVAHTTVTTGSTIKIELPEASDFHRLLYSCENTLWIGPSDDIVPEGEGAFPVMPGVYFPLNLKKGNDSELYGIAEGGDIEVYVFSEIDDSSV